MSTPIPYGFTPIDPDSALTDEPLWRDGSSSAKRYSGELLLTLEALTPLIVGNHRSEAPAQAPSPSQQKTGDNQPKSGSTPAELFPQCLPDGRVLLPGSSLKGMIRSTLARLLHAPMERVTEHHYTYRPNLGFGPREQPPVELRPAVIEKVEGERENAKVTVRLLPADTAVVFVRSNAYNRLGEANPGGPVKGLLRGVEITGNGPRQRLDESQNKSTPLDHVLLHYAGGIDGDGHFANAFNNGKVYRHVLVPQDKYAKGRSVPLPDRLLRAYYATQSVLADDHHGHLSPGHPLTSGGNLNTNQVAKAIKNNASLKQHQLIYIEFAVSPSEQERIKLRPLTMGHHFQYRWAYTSSVRYHNALLGKDHEKYKLRPELALHPQERAGANGAPEQLTAARLLFGYALEGDHTEQGVLAQNNFKRLAGRIAFNHALEVADGKSLADRFVDEGQPIQFKILGMPRPSAVEFYLKQLDLPRKLATYGDTPSDSGGDLAGRKFYRHQPDAKNRPNAYRAEAKDANAAERGTIIHYLSNRGSQFRATVRFDSLRPWELGALLVAIEPQLLAQLLELPPNSHGYAHKLGYGKPLGLGSIRCVVDGARWQENDSWQWTEVRSTEEPAWQHVRNNALAAFREKLQATWVDETTAKAKRWLNAYQWKERGVAAYPTMPDKNGKITIYQYHTNIRKLHAEVRRGGSANFAKFDIKNRIEPST